MRIALATTEYGYPPHPPLGVARFVYVLAHGLKAAGHEVIVTGPGRETRTLDDDGVRVEWFRFRRPRAVGWLLDRRHLCNRIRSRCENRGIDIAEVPDWLGLLPFSTGRCPVVVRLHLTETIAASIAGGNQAKISRRWAEARTLATHRNWIGVSQFSLEVTKNHFGIAPVRSRVVYNPVQRSSLTKVRTQVPENYILVAGSICKRKATDVAVQAFSRIANEFPTLHVVLAGPETDGEWPLGAKKTLTALAGNVAPERLIFTGHIQHGQLMSLMKNAQLVLVPSRLETFGLVAAEAMMHGTPTVVSDAGALSEIVQNGQSGIVCSVDSIAEFSSAIREVMTNDAYARSLGEEGARQAEERFSIGRCVEETLQFYGELL